MEFLEIGADRDHVHFLVQSVPAYSPTQIIRIIKSLTARELFKAMPELKKSLWGSAFWSSGFFVHSVGRHGSETVIRRYVKQQGMKDYQQIHAGQLDLFASAEQTGQTEP